MAEHRQKLILSAVGVSQLLHSRRRLARRVRRVTSDSTVDRSGAAWGMDVVDVLAVDPRPRLLHDEWQALKDPPAIGIDDENAVLCEGQTGKARFGSEHRRARVGFGGATDEQDRGGPFVVKAVSRRALVVIRALDVAPADPHARKHAFCHDVAKYHPENSQPRRQ